MAYVVPTLEIFRARFPIFADKEDAVIQMIIAEAASRIGETWIEADYQPAILYLSAHMLATDNSGAGEAVNVGDGANGVTAESFGGMSITYGKASSSSSSELEAEYGRTSYGRRFLGLLRANFPAIVSI